MFRSHLTVNWYKIITKEENKDPQCCYLYAVLIAQHRQSCRDAIRLYEEDYTQRVLCLFILGSVIQILVLISFNTAGLESKL